MIRMMRHTEPNNKTILLNEVGNGARILYNPYHDRQGRFTSGTGIGAAVSIHDPRAREVAGKAAGVGGGTEGRHLIGVGEQEGLHAKMLKSLHDSGFSDHDIAMGHRAMEEWGATVRRTPKMVDKFRDQLAGKDNSPGGRVVAAYARDTQQRMTQLHPSGQVTLYRGVHMEQGGGLSSGSVHLRVNDVSSWSASRSAAEKFGRVIEARIPTKDVVLSYHAAPWKALHPDEAEYVVSTPGNVVQGTVR